MARCLLSGLRDEPRDRPADRRAPSGGHAGPWPAVLLVSGLGTDAEVARALRPAAGQAPSGIAMITRAKSSRERPAWRCLGGYWIGQKKDKSGKGKATDHDRPVPHVEAKNSTLRHCGDEL
jgi:hypothetical protein